MAEDRVFDNFHKFNTLVRRGLEEPIRCSRCYTPLSTGFGKDDSLILDCYGCGAALQPGQSLIWKVEETVRKYFG